MIIDEYVEIIGNSRNIKYYKEKGYDIKVGENIFIKVEDLSNGSTFKVNVKCDICYEKKNITWSSYVKCKKNDEENKYYCKKCNLIKRKRTNQEKYGGDSPTKCKEVVDKIKKTNLERYGNNSSLHGVNQEKLENIFFEKYGEKTPLLNEKIKNKIKKTNLEKYGAEHPLKSKEIINKLKETCLEKYGVDNPSKSIEIINRIKETNLEKWGTEWYYQSDDFKEKAKKTILEKYGDENYFKTIHRKKFILENKIENYPDLNFIDYDSSFFEINCDECGNNFEIKTDVLYKRYKDNRIICTKCNKLYNNFRSSAEIEICDFLEKNNIKIESSKRDLIKGELDIYLPDYKIAIEYNGLYWHNESFKDKNYHIDKYRKCKEKDIKLIQIWEDQWNNDKEKVKSFLLNKLKIYKNKIYARNCKIKIIDYKEKDIFLNENHLQNTSRSSINIGLYHNNTLVSIMTFGKRKLNSKDNFELIRYCSKKDYIIIGGASKLFNFFINEYEFNEIISYSDNTVSDGEIYEILNFENTNENLNFYWTNNKERYHRYTFNKKRLVKKGYDINKTGLEIMRENGFNRIFGAGIKTWVYKKINL